MTPRTDLTTSPVEVESSHASTTEVVSGIPIRSEMRPTAYAQAQRIGVVAPQRAGARWARRQFCARYFEQLDAEYTALCPADYQVQHEQQLVELRARSAADPTWETNHRLEYLITNGLPAPLLQQRIPLERERLQSLFSSAEAAAVLAHFESTPTGDSDRDRSIALGLLCELQRTRLVQSEFTHLRNRLTAVLLLAGATIGSFIGSQLYGEAFRYLPPAAYAVLAGLLGGYFSVLLRLGALRWSREYNANYHQVDRLFVNLLPALALAMFEGGVAALILYTVFLSGMVEGSMFPRFIAVASDGTWTATSTWLWMAPSDSYGVAKLIVWATLAGFSERLVPDLLTSLAKERIPSNDATRSARETASVHRPEPAKS